jgi:hypothetical protein
MQELLVYEVRAPRILQFWENCDRLVRSVLLALEDRVEADFEKRAIATVCNEMLENVLKYSNWGQEKRPLFHFEFFDDRRAIVRTQNVIDFQQQHHLRLQELLQVLHKTDTAKEAYEARVRDIASKGYDAKTSAQLGLLRLAHETRCTIDGDLNIQGVLTMEAKLDLNWMWA